MFRVTTDQLDQGRREKLKSQWRETAARGPMSADDIEALTEIASAFVMDHGIEDPTNVDFAFRMGAHSEGQFFQSPDVTGLFEQAAGAGDLAMTALRRTAIQNARQAVTAGRP